MWANDAKVGTALHWVGGGEVEGAVGVRTGCSERGERDHVAQEGLVEVNAEGGGAGGKGEGRGLVDDGDGAV